MRLVLLYPSKTGIAKHLVKMNKKETILPRLYNIWTDITFAIPEHIQTENERNIGIHPFTVEIGDFVFRIKAKNAFHYDPTISPVRLYKYTFFVQYYAR